MSDKASEEDSGGRRGSRGGGREGRRRRDASSEAHTGLEGSANFIQNLKPYEPLEADQMAKVRENADRLLKEVGVEFHEDEVALELWKKAGAKVEGVRVRMEIAMLEEIIRKTAPKTFTQHARNPERSLTVGGRNTIHAPVYGPPFVSDLEGGRRYAKIEDFQNFVKLAYMSPGLNHSGGTVCEPVDLPVNKRHLDMLYSHIRYSDKPFMGSVTSPERAQDTVDMAKVVFGEDFVDENCCVISLINVNSPLVFDATMTGALKVYARNNQATVVSPFMLSGAMGPVTVPAVLAQVYAEACTGCAFTQLIRPGCPVVFGAFVPSVSMQSGAPMFGSSESAYIVAALAQIVRALGLPFRTGGSLCGSKIPDAQAAYESTRTMDATTMAGVNFVLHSAGWLEGGLVSSYEKLVMDAEQLIQAGRLLKGQAFDENGFAASAYQEVAPGGHFLGCDHTQDNFKTAFYTSPLDDNNSFEQWEIEGKTDMVQRANKHWKEMLAAYQAPDIDPEVDKAVKDFIQNKKDAEPDSWI